MRIRSFPTVYCKIHTLLLWGISMVFGLWSMVVFSQTDFRIINQYTQKDGLSNSTIYVIYEDSRGFLWLATKEGLNRFDGYRFKSFYHNKYEPNSLPHNTVNDILEYQPGMLLIATANGLAVFNASINKFENELIVHRSLAPGEGANVTSLHKDRDGNIWVNQNGELDILDTNLNYQYRFTDLEWARGLKGCTIAYEEWQSDKQGRMWLPTDTSGIQIIDVKNKTIYNRNHNPDSFPFMQFRHIRSMLIDSESNQLYFAPWGDGIYTYKFDSGTMHHQDFGQPLTESGSVNDIIRLENGNLLCSSNGIFFETNPLTLVFHRIDFPFKTHSSGSKNEIHPITIVRSNSERYWIGANEGLFQLQQNVQQAELSIASVTGSSACVDLIVATTRDIYALYDHGMLIETDQSGKSFVSYHLPLRPGDFITQMCEDKQKQLWITTSHGLLQLDLTGKKFVKPNATIATLAPYFVNAVYSDQDGDLWIGTRQPFGLYHYDYKKESLQKIENDAVRQMGMSGEYARISSFTQDRQGNLWIRSVASGGILQLEKNTGQWTRYPKDENKISVLENKGLYSLYPDGEGYLWLSTTVGDGLIRYDYKTDEIKQFNREDGLSSDYIFQINEWHDHLWLASANGYTTFNMRDLSMHSEDWPDMNGDFDLVMDTLKNQMIMGAQGKLVFISMHENEPGGFVPVPVIDAIYVNNKEQYIDARRTKMRLPYDQKNITVDYTAAYYDDVDEIHFAYFLSGADQEWQYPKETRTAQYAALSPGNYVFRIKASDANGKWGEPQDAFAFTIVPPFWQRLWFFALLAILMVTGVYYAGRKRMKMVRYESGLKQKVAETEMMALRAQMNPHFIFNSINSIDALIQNDDKYQATLYLNKFAKLIRNILDSSKQNTVTLEKDMETLRLYIDLEQLRSENEFIADIDIDPSIMQKDIRVPPLIIQPYVENAIQHGIRNRADDLGQLHISLRHSHEGLEYVIEDNGVGRKASMNGRRAEKVSYGMQMSHDRIMIFNREENASVKITDLDGNGIASGTRVEIKLKSTYIS
ncbi:MAG TPA: two-component regulator propeller domain-containing protein [Saprospiraceae bacterium]|nr:two-component regulator propeller domain-containing protein [Saprospiraceae bacterium]